MKHMVSRFTIWTNCHIFPLRCTSMIIISPFFRGAFLEDAMFVSCGHSFGGLTLRKVIEMVSQTSFLVPIKCMTMIVFFEIYGTC